jgi:hypothetical protein
MKDKPTKKIADQIHQLVANDPVAAMATGNEREAYEYFAWLGYQLAKEKKPKDQFPEYHDFIRTWTEKYPTILQFPRDGGIIKKLITATREQLALRKIIPTTEKNIEFWGIFVGNLHRTWAGGKVLSTIYTHYAALIYELERPKQQQAVKSITDQATDFLSRI